VGGTPALGRTPRTRSTAHFRRPSATTSRGVARQHGARPEGGGRGLSTRSTLIGRRSQEEIQAEEDIVEKRRMFGGRQGQARLRPTSASADHATPPTQSPHAAPGGGRGRRFRLRSVLRGGMDASASRYQSRLALQDGQGQEPILLRIPASRGRLAQAVLQLQSSRRRSRRRSPWPAGRQEDAELLRGRRRWPLREHAAACASRG